MNRLALLFTDLSDEEFLKYTNLTYLHAVPDFS